MSTCAPATACSFAPLTPRPALIYFAKRRTVERNDGGWYASTINKYVTCGDEQTYRKNFRVTKATLLDISERLKSAGPT